MAYDATKLLRLKHLKQLAEVVKDNKDAIAELEELVGTEDVPSQIQDAIDDIVGDSSDDSSVDTINGVRNLANSKVASVTAGDASIAIGGTATAPTVAVALSATAGNNIALENDGLYVTVPAAAEYTMTQKATANTGYAASYQLTKNGTAVGVDINIPKDFLVKSGSVETVTVDDEPYSGAVVGDKYLDFVINAVDASETAQHIYIPVNDLVDAYTAGNGIAISAGNEISAVVDSNNANGLTVGQNGIALAPASASANGAMSSADFAKLSAISANATSVSVPTNWDGTISVDGVSKTVVDIATDAEVNEMLAEVFPVAP